MTVGTRFDFRNRTVLVTGGARGIGLELSRQLAVKGAKIIAIGRQEKHLNALADELGTAVATRKADLSHPEAAREIVAWLKTEHPECSVLINNAAIMQHCDLTRESDARPAEIASEVTINLTAPIQLAVAMLPLLKTHVSGAIVNITSGLAIAPKRNAAVYCATKAGLRSFTRSLRDQCRSANLNIQVSEAVMTLVDTTLSCPAPVKKYPPAKAAMDVIAGAEKGHEEIWIEKTRHLYLLHRLSPSLTYRMMRGR